MNPLASFEIDHNGGLPPWIQLRNRIAYLISSGVYHEGDRLPTVRALGADLDISYNTVNRAYMDLEHDGYITTRKGRGTFVAGTGLGMGQEEYASIGSMAEDLINAARNLGMDDGSILALVQEKLS